MKKRLNARGSIENDREMHFYLHKFHCLLEEWYNDNKRDLPWRETKDPYIIWISEIILQQTRVDQGKDYFERFIRRFPNIQSLAEASDDEVLKLWQGLGYYSRARNLLFSAKMLLKDFGGVFPNVYEEILSLKGVGEYTAAAIASFSFDKPYAVLDGNVFRVLSRLFAEKEPIDTAQGKKAFSSLAQLLLNKKQPGAYNQAIMELGALQCVPVSPQCSLCPMSAFCLALANDEVSKYPMKEGKTKTRNRFFHYFDIRFQNYMYIQRRTSRDIWQGLYEFPLIETSSDLDSETFLQSKEAQDIFIDINNVKIGKRVKLKHILSHQIIYVSFYQVIIDSEGAGLVGFERIESSQIDEYPIPRLIDKYLERL